MEKNAINFSEEVQHKIDFQKARISEANEALKADFNAENVRAYQNAIGDFVSFAVTQIYLLSTRSGWRDIPCRDLYDKASGIELLLKDLNGCLGSGDTQSAGRQCDKIALLLDALLMRN